MCDWMMGKTTRSNGQRGKRSVEVKHKGREGQVVEGGEAVEGGEVELPDDCEIVDTICRVLGKLGPRTVFVVVVQQEVAWAPGRCYLAGQQQQKRLPPLLALDTSSQRWSLSHRF